jgi:hypothetical protein
MLYFRNVSKHLTWSWCTEVVTDGSELWNVGLEVLSAVVLKSTIFSDITQCSPLKIDRCFGGIYLLRLQGRRTSRARNRRENRFLRNVSYFQWTTRRSVPQDSTLGVVENIENRSQDNERVQEHTVLCNSITILNLRHFLCLLDPNSWIKRIDV